MNDPNPFADRNPYESPGVVQPTPSGSVATKVKAPAIALLVVASLGILGSVFSLVHALTQDPGQIVDPNAPDFIQEFQRGGVGKLTAVIQAGFLIYNALIVFGAIQMLKMKSWPWSLAASIMSVVNVGTCCCVLGLPCGIWSIIVLSMADVKLAFTNARTT